MNKHWRQLQGIHCLNKVADNYFNTQVHWDRYEQDDLLSSYWMWMCYLKWKFCPNVDHHCKGRKYTTPCEMQRGETLQHNKHTKKTISVVQTSNKPRTTISKTYILRIKPMSTNMCKQGNKLLVSIPTGHEDIQKHFVYFLLL